MKLYTHLVTGFCVAFSTALYLGLDLKSSILVATASLFLNYLIDAIGHRGYRRSPFMHSFVGVTLSTTALFLALSVLELYVPTMKYIGIELGPRTFLACYAGALTHLLLDAFTGSGIYLAYPFTRKRFAIAHLSYDNPVANTIATAFAIALLLYIAWSRYGHVVSEVMTWLGR